jgi:dihydroorotate dehydrogenase (NAD+) catalytic subunit
MCEDGRENAAPKKPDLRTALCGLDWNNPIATASGTFSPRDSGQFYDFSKLGAIVTKGLTCEPWQGNPTPRIAETWGGMLNAVGLENPGVEVFLRKDLPYIRKAVGRFGARVIVNVAGRSAEEYCAAAERLDDADVDMLELNISCPNIKEGGVAFGTDVRLVTELVGAVRRRVKKPLIVKLTPNVTDICSIAKAAEAAGADAVSLINTLLAMRIDVKKRAPLLANGTGGLSGPAIKPVALRMVSDVSRAVRIPVVGMGGVMTGLDAAEFLMAGAAAVAVGTAALVNPTAPVDILAELEAVMAENGFATIGALRDAFSERAYG